MYSFSDFTKMVDEFNRLVNDFNVLTNDVDKDDSKDVNKNKTNDNGSYYHFVSDKYENGQHVSHKEKEVRDGNVIKDVDDRMNIEDKCKCSNETSPKKHSCEIPSNENDCEVSALKKELKECNNTINKLNGELNEYKDSLNRIMREKNDYKNSYMNLLKKISSIVKEG